MTTTTDAARGGAEATAGAFAPTVPPRRWRTVERFPDDITNQLPTLHHFDRFGYDVAVRAGNGPRSALDATLADIARESGHGVSDAIEALRNHVIDAEERPKLEAHAQKNIALWHAFLNEVRAAGVNNVRAIRSA